MYLSHIDSSTWNTVENNIKFICFFCSDETLHIMELDRGLERHKKLLWTKLKHPDNITIIRIKQRRNKVIGTIMTNFNIIILKWNTRHEYMSLYLFGTHWYMYRAQWPRDYRFIHISEPGFVASPLIKMNVLNLILKFKVSEITFVH